MLRLQTEITTGSLTAVVGPNGAGKSTLLKGVVGTLSPLAGSLSFGAIKKTQIAYLPQQSEIDRSFPMTVAELVAMGLWREIGAFTRVKRSHRTRMKEVISAVGLTGFETRSIGSLSGGQIQRALFARLLLQDAQLVLLDEPFNSIDTRTMNDLIGAQDTFRLRVHRNTSPRHPFDLHCSTTSRVLILFNSYMCGC